MPNFITKINELKDTNKVIINPFIHNYYGNFWQEKNITSISSINVKGRKEVEEQLKVLVSDPLHKIRTIVIRGDPGSGKSHLLGRLKQELNSEAFFVYIQPIEDKSYIWQHTLQHTVNSLTYIPEGETESQIRLWLKSLPIFTKLNWFQSIIGQKKAFIRDLKRAYPVGIFEAKKFFSVLYELATDNYDLACEWLAGEDLDEEDLGILGINKSIDNEKMARGILSNFGRIADATKPIILCFDQVERAYEGLFNLNTTFHNECFVNFLIIISTVRENWEDYKKGMIQSDLARISSLMSLKNISFDETEKLWQSRLKVFYQQYNIIPSHPLEPLNQNELKKYSPRNQINLREALNLGGKLFQEYIDNLSENKSSTITPPVVKSELVKLWQQTLASLTDEIKDLMKYSDKEFSLMVRAVLSALAVENINPRFLTGVVADYSFTYESPLNGKKYGLIWSNTRSGNTFNTVMKKCEEVIRKKSCQKLFLVRNRIPGNPNTNAHDIYQSIFKPLSGDSIHYKPKVKDFQCLIAYYQLAKKAYSKDLILENKTVSLQKLHQLVRKHKIFSNSPLLKAIEIVQSTS